MSSSLLESRELMSFLAYKKWHTLQGGAHQKLQQIFPMYSVHAGESAGFQKKKEGGGGGGGGGGLDVPGDGESKWGGKFKGEHALLD